MIRSQRIRILFAGGGTGGHLFPAIAIADRLRELLASTADTDILFVGTRRGLEYRMRDKLGYPLHVINVRGLARSLTLKNLLVPFVFITALLKSHFLLRRYQPDIVVGTGGYVSLPVLKTANWKRIPTVVQEQNSYPGISTRQLARDARRIYLGFEGARAGLHAGDRVLVTGNPVRRTIADGNREKALAEYDLDPRKKTVLVIGGSQGARAINNAVVTSLRQNPLPDGYQLLWQTGVTDFAGLRDSIGERSIRIKLVAFVNDMETFYAVGDIAIARAGALTLAELTACGIPAVLVPYPHAAGNHQRKNALFLQERNMAHVIDESRLSQTNILQETISIMESDRYDRMKRSLVDETVGKRPAVDVIAEDIIALIEERRKAEA